MGRYFAAQQKVDGIYADLLSVAQATDCLSEMRSYQRQYKQHDPFESAEDALGAYNQKPVAPMLQLGQ